jgi:phosphoribosylglycinamide formyltransferase-1
MPKIAILLSGRGTNMVALARSVALGDLDADIRFVGSDRPDAEGLARAEALSLPTLVLPYREKGKDEAEELLLGYLDKNGVEWVVLAGFMRILSPRVVSRFRDRIANIHPALLPAFPGTGAIESAWNYGVKVTGVTVHLVDEEMDHGPILAQRCVPIDEGQTLEELEERIHEVEHDIYWRTLKDLFAGRYKKEGRRMKLDRT